MAAPALGRPARMVHAVVISAVVISAVPVNTCHLKGQRKQGHRAWQPTTSLALLCTPSPARSDLPHSAAAKQPALPWPGGGARAVTSWCCLSIRRSMTVLYTQ